MRTKTTGMDWLKRQIKKLEASSSKHKDTICKIQSIEPQICNEFKAWTPLKLILLNYSLSMCSTIISKIIKERSFIFKEMHYVDLFAGSGLIKMKNDLNDYFIGSPFIAALNHLDEYDSMIFCENDNSFASALGKRVAIVNANSKIKVFNCDYKAKIDEIVLPLSREKVYSFFFVDPCSMEFNWDSMKKILNLRSDILFNFMTSQIHREVEAAKKRKGIPGKLIDFYGGDEWKHANNDDEMIGLYIQKIKSERKKAIVSTIKIKSTKHSFHYHMLFITTQTRGENQWIRAIEQAKNEIEMQSDKAVEMAINIIKKRQRCLCDFENAGLGEEDNAKDM